VHDEEDDKRYTTLLYTDDGAGRLTGTVRIRRWEPGQVPAKDWGGQLEDRHFASMYADAAVSAYSRAARARQSP
jgi:hypothetical protein